MPVNISGSGSITGLSVGGLNDGIITPSELSTGGPSWDAAGDLRVNAINSGPLAGMRNAIINGDMRVAQRGTSFAAVANGTYTLDRWEWGRGPNSDVVTVSRATTVPNDTFINSLLIDVTTADASMAAAEYGMIVQKIEGYNIRHLIGKTFTLSFWVRSPKTGTHCIAFRNSGPDRSYIATYTVNAANTWEFKSITVANGFITDGTWDWTNGIGVNIAFVLACGSTFQTTAGAWQTGNFLATSAQVNCLDSTANDFYLTGVQLEEGPVATPFERRPYGLEDELCKRYFEIVNGFLSGYATGSVTVTYNGSFGRSMRITPNITVTQSGNTGCTGSTITAIGNRQWRFTATATSSFIGSADASASAEL